MKYGTWHGDNEQRMNVWIVEWIRLKLCVFFNCKIIILLQIVDFEHYNSILGEIWDNMRCY